MRAMLAVLALAGLVTTAQAEVQTKYNFTGTLFAPDKPKKANKTKRIGVPVIQPANTTPNVVLAPQRSSYGGMEVVSYSRSVKPGTIVINTSERSLYYVLPNGMAERYGVGVGREGFTWRGTQRISRKTEWPSWTPPARMIEREKAKGITLPAFMPGGPNNPLGARAMYLGGSLFRIHGTNQPASIGLAVSSGCIRMLNEEVAQLYDKVNIGTLVIVE
ncbi:MAG: L,D-transpeptidase [Parvibaculaceae bacterium]